MQLGKTIMTNAGIALQNEAVTTAVPIILTTMKIGTGAVATIEEALALTDLVLVYEDTGISKVVNESNIYKVTTTYDNETNTSEVTITEIGIYAKLGDTGTPVLFAYTNEDPGTVLPIRGTGAVLEIEKTLGVGITELATVNITVVSGIYALQEIQIIAGAGLTGGGDLSANRTINVISADDGIIVNADNIKLNIVDNLTTASATRALSANQGKYIKDNTYTKVESDANFLTPAEGDSKYVNSAGDTMDGPLYIKKQPGQSTTTINVADLVDGDYMAILMRDTSIDLHYGIDSTFIGDIASVDRETGAVTSTVFYNKAESDANFSLLENEWRINAKVIGSSTTSIDLNTILEKGEYKSNSVSNLFTNMPPEHTTGAFSLTVGGIQPDGSYGYQTFYGYNTTRIWHRINLTSTINSPIWGSWVEITNKWKYKNSGDVYNIDANNIFENGEFYLLVNDQSIIPPSASGSNFFLSSRFSSENDNGFGNQVAYGYDADAPLMSYRAYWGVTKTWSAWESLATREWVDFRTKKGLAYATSPYHSWAVGSGITGSYAMRSDILNGQYSMRNGTGSSNGFAIGTIAKGLSTVNNFGAWALEGTAMTDASNTTFTVTNRGEGGDGYAYIYQQYYSSSLLVFYTKIENGELKFTDNGRDGFESTGWDLVTWEEWERLNLLNAQEKIYIDTNNQIIELPKPKTYAENRKWYVYNPILNDWEIDPVKSKSICYFHLKNKARELIEVQTMLLDTTQLASERDALKLEYDSYDGI